MKKQLFALSLIVCTAFLSAGCCPNKDTAAPTDPPPTPTSIATFNAIVYWDTKEALDAIDAALAFDPTNTALTKAREDAKSAFDRAFSVLVYGIDLSESSNCTNADGTPFEGDHSYAGGSGIESHASYDGRVLTDAEQAALTSVGMTYRDYGFWVKEERRSDLSIDAFVAAVKAGYQVNTPPVVSGDEDGDGIADSNGRNNNALLRTVASQAASIPDAFSQATDLLVDEPKDDHPNDE